MSLKKDVNDAIQFFIANLTKEETKRPSYLIITIGPCNFRFSLQETMKNQHKFTSKIIPVLEANEIIEITESTEIKLRTEAHRTIQDNDFFREGRALAGEQPLTPEYVYEATVGKGVKKIRSSSIERDDEHRLSSISPVPDDETKPSPF